MAKIKLSHGMNNSIEREIVDGTPVSQVVTAPIKQLFGLGENMDTVINGVIVSPQHAVYDGDEISWRPKAGDKGC